MTNSHLKSMHTKRPYVDGNPIPGLGQAQTCGVGVKEVNRIPTFTLLTIRFPMAYIDTCIHKQTMKKKTCTLLLHSKRLHTITTIDNVNMDSTIAGSMNVHS